jgi:hypothetical protein
VLLVLPDASINRVLIGIVTDYPNNPADAHY